MSTLSHFFEISLVFLCFQFVVYCQQEKSVVCVIEQNSKLSKPCQFPFIFEERLFEKCTDYTDKKGKLWCSTNVNSDGKHITNMRYWGYCNTNDTSCIPEEVIVL